MKRAGKIKTGGEEGGGGGGDGGRQREQRSVKRRPVPFIIHMSAS